MSDAINERSLSDDVLNGYGDLSTSDFADIVRPTITCSTNGSRSTTP